MFYAADNQYSTPTSVGFSNTWSVLAFESKTARDAWVKMDDGLAARAIKRTEIAKYLDREPKPFTGECYALTRPYWTEDDCTPSGLIGYISVAHRDDPDFVEPLNK